MKPLLLAAAVLIAIAWLAGCAYFPRIGVNVGFMGATVGVEVGGEAPPRAIPVALPKPEGLRK